MVGNATKEYFHYKDRNMDRQIDRQTNFDYKLNKCKKNLNSTEINPYSTP